MQISQFSHEVIFVIRLENKTLSLDNIAYHLRKCLRGKNTNIDEVSSNKIILCEENESFAKPAFYIPSELEKIVSLHPETRISKEMSRMNGGTRRHSATLAWEIEKVKLKIGSFYKNNYKKKFPDIQFNKIESSISPQDFDKLSLVSSYQGIKYFAHWLHDDVPTFELAKEFAQPFSIKSEYWHDNKQYANIFDQSWSWLEDGYIKKLYIFQDYSQNRLKVERYKKLRKKIRRKFSSVNNGGFVYIKRGNTGKNVRTLNNENELIDSLVKLNFVIIDITSDPLTKTIQYLLDAKFVLTIEGSHSTHALYTIAEDACLMVIVSPTLFSNTAKDWVESLDMDYGFVVGTDEGANSFSVDLNSVFKTIEMMLG